MKKIFSLLLIATALASCETLVNDVDPSRLPSTSNQLVVHGYLSPQDTLLQVSVRASGPVTGANIGGGFGSEAPSFPNATVTLTNQNRTVNLVLRQGSSHYTAPASSMPIVAGQTYNLSVTFNGQTVTSSCTIPQAVAINEVRQDSVAVQGFVISNPGTISTPKDRTYRLFWQDPVGQSNYYQVSGYMLAQQRVQTGMNQFREQPVVGSIFFNERGRGSGSLLSDEKQDGARMASNTGRLGSFWFSSSSNIIRSTRSVTLSLIACEKTYYDYHRILEIYESDNPFAEPTLLPNNIKGGLGCFAGYNRTDFNIKTP
jgi:Domain of unknown function (DUF4249)